MIYRPDTAFEKYNLKAVITLFGASIILFGIALFLRYHNSGYSFETSIEVPAHPESLAENAHGPIQKIPGAERLEMVRGGESI